MKYLREYKLNLDNGVLHIGVTEDNEWVVELKSAEWKPVQSSDKPIWVDNRKWEKIPDKLGIDKVKWTEIRSSVHEQEMLNETEQIEDKDEFSDEIRSKAIDILENGEPIEYFLNVFNEMHVGDRELGQLMMCCVASQHCVNSLGLHPKLSGESGMGKSDAIETFLHLCPKWAYIHTSMSSKAIFYHDLPQGLIIFLDDYKQNDDLDAIIKQTSSNFHATYEHRTIDKDRKSQILLAPPEIVWAITSVDSSQDIQVLNRQVGLDVDASIETTQNVIRHVFDMAKEGAIRFPETEEVEICRCIIAEIKKQSFGVVVPFADRFEWKDTSSRRNPSIFLDILRSITIWHFKQRSTDEEGNLVSTETDFFDAKRLYIGRADTLVDKLTKAERRLVQYLVEREGHAYKDEAMVALGITSQRISQLIRGENGKTGLLQKLAGFDVESVMIKDDYRNVTKMNLIYSNWKEYKRLDAYQDAIILQEIDEKGKTYKDLHRVYKELTSTYLLINYSKKVCKDVRRFGGIIEENYVILPNNKIISLIDLENCLTSLQALADSEKIEKSDNRCKVLDLDNEKKSKNNIIEPTDTADLVSKDPANIYKTFDKIEMPTPIYWLVSIFLEKCPKFVGIDGKIYGPFEKNDVAMIPKINSIGLIEKNVCRQINVGV